MREITDKIILGLVAGLIGNIPKVIINEILVQKGIEKKRFAEIVAGILVTRKEAISKKGVVFGFLGDFATASFLGIPLVYLLSKTGKNHKIIKSGMMGLVGLGIYRGIIAQLGNKGTYPTDVVTNASMSMTSTLWGVCAGILATRFGHKSVFEQEKASKLIIQPQRESRLNQTANNNQLTGEINHKKRVRKHVVPVPSRKQRRN